MLRHKIQYSFHSFCLSCQNNLCTQIIAYLDVLSNLLSHNECTKMSELHGNISVQLHYAKVVSWGGRECIIFSHNRLDSIKEHHYVHVNKQTNSITGFRRSPILTVQVIVLAS